MSNTREKYSDDEIIMQLKNHFRKNTSISVTSFSADRETCSVRTVILRFGSWKKGLEKAGLKGKEIKKYSDEEIIKELKKYNSKNGNISRRKFNEDPNTCSSYVVMQRFGSWTNALKLAGVYIPKKEKLTKNQILHQLKDFYAKNSVITAKSFDKDETVCGVTTIRNYFGSWSNALIAANLKEKEIKKIYSDEELIEMYREFSLKIGKEKNGATKKELVESGFPNAYSLDIRFTSINELRKLSGFEQNRIRNVYKKDEIALLLYNEYKKYKRVLLKKEVEELENFPSLTTIFRNFKTLKMSEVWAEVLKNKETLS